MPDYNYISITLVVETLLYIFHLSVLILLVIKHQTYFKGPFFTIFKIVLLADLASFIFMITSKKIPQYNLFLDFYKTNAVFAYIAFHGISFVTAVQFLGHTLMAFNRFTLIWFPIKQKRIWNRQWYTVVLLGIPVIHVASRVTEPGILLFVSETNISVTLKSKEALATYLLITAIIYIGTTCIAAILNILSFSKFYFHKKLSSAINVNEKSLLSVSLIVFFAQLIRCSYNINRTLFPSNAELAAFFIEALPYFSDIFALSGSISLLILSKTFRNQYQYFYFFGYGSKTSRITAFSGTPKMISTNFS